jgi:hypothetical protein
MAGPGRFLDVLPAGRRQVRRLLRAHRDCMIDSMPTALRKLVALLAAVAFLLPAASARAQDEGGVTWEEAPDPAGEGVAPDSQAHFVEPAPDEAYADTDPRALTDFDRTLRPYGRWHDDPTYGRVWVPHRKAVGPDFAPYVTSGRWALTPDNEWIWVSDYPFGWVVFHYGRWVWIESTGWAWIPGRQYSHAWVVWRVPEPGYYYVGWSPMPPDYIWVNGVAIGIGFGVYYTWAFCPSAYVFHHHMGHYVLHDHHHVHYAAAHTHRYRPPRGHSSHSGPPPARAHIPASAVPKTRTPANPKAIAASSPSGGTTPRRAGPAPRSGATRASDIGPAPQSRSLRGTPAPGAAQPRAQQPPPRSAPPPQRYAPPSRGYSPPPQRAAPPPQQAAPPPQRSSPPPQQAAPPPQRSSPPPQQAAPPPQRSSPPPERAAPPPARAAPPPARAAPPPPRYSPPPQRSAPPARSAPRGRR